ncbi:MAG: hypothetical protein HKN25_14450 [Pyrinomonadaceae bacterium]|nr:hypothetical protein [Pyrinomonadaceae bacterium]
MRILKTINRNFGRLDIPAKNGFTLVEVLVAAIIMIILSIGILTVFSNVTERNRGENLRIQALSVLQLEVEYYRSLKFVPGAQTAADLPNHRNADLYAGSHTLSPVTTLDGRVFNVTAVVTNVSPSTDEHLCKFKEIVITATPASAEGGWLSNLGTSVTIQRVRSN